MFRITGESQFVKPGFGKSTLLINKNEKGKIKIYQHLGTFIKQKSTNIVRYRSVFKPQKFYMVKYALNKKAVKEIKTEFKQLTKVHAEAKKIGLETIGIQLEPKSFIKIGLDNKSKSYGMMTDEYETDGADLIASSLSAANTHKILLQSFSGLSVLKKLKRRHADIKPQNLFISPQFSRDYSIHISDLEDSKKLKLKSSLKNFTTSPMRTEKYYNEKDKEKLDEFRKKLKIAIQNLNNKNLSPQESETIKKEIKQLKIQIRELYFAWDVYSMCKSMLKMLPKTHIPLNVTKLLKEGLNDDYTKRPSVEKFLEAMQPAHTDEIIEIAEEPVTNV